VPAAKTYRVSVKKFVDFACRQGDLVHTGPAGPTALEGQHAHKKLQQQKSADEQSEVKVATSITIDNLTLKLGGRIDLLRMPGAANGMVSVGEIKSCYAPPDKQPQSTVELHWAQLKVYGYCLLTGMNAQLPPADSPVDLTSAVSDGANSVESSNHTKDDATADNQQTTTPLSQVNTNSTTINLRLIWVNLQTDEVTIDSRDFHLAELQRFIMDAAARYLGWMQRITQSQIRLRKTARSLQFPHYHFRDGQRKMAASIYVTTRDKKTLLCEAPTGIGKTVSALFPAIKSIGEKHVKTVVYLTAKNSGRESANACIQQLSESGLELTSITVTSKKPTCHCSNGTCERDPDGRCPLTVGFFDRLPEARAELLDIGTISPKAVDAMAHKYQLCPFELTLQMLPWVGVIICDYNYVFDPLVSLTHFLDNAGSQLLLIDEAHNLPERARSMYSAQLVRADLKSAARECSDQPLMAKEIERVVRAMDRWAKAQSAEESASEDVPATISRAVDKCADSFAALTENNVALSEKTIDVARELYRYRVIAELFGDHHRTITLSSAAKSAKKYREKQITVQLRCLNATHSLAQSFKQFRSATVFSATLRPTQFSRDCLGLPEDTYCLALDSPFPPDNQGTFLCNWIDTRYRARDRAVAPLVDLAAQVYNSRQGNYQIFFPSYYFMEKVYSAFTVAHPNIPTIIQQRDADEATRQQFISRFETDDNVLAFSILGGIYGEGVDYTGDQLIGAIVIGTGLPALSLEQKLIEQDYSRRGLNGFDYASRYPGMTRVLQTAGRVIRSETDQGVVILVDQRLAEPFYQSLFPAHWQIEHCNSKENFQHSLMHFWSRTQGQSPPLLPIPDHALHKPQNAPQNEREFTEQFTPKGTSEHNTG
jgi:Rad3-related DNA helicase